MIAVNARTFNPAVIDSSGNVEFMNPNANYTMDGTEKYVNWGWFLPKGMEQLTPGAGNTFTVTFEKPGLYNYLCILHPWMTGSIVVKWGKHGFLNRNNITRLQIISLSILICPNSPLESN